MSKNGRENLSLSKWQTKTGNDVDKDTMNDDQSSPRGNTDLSDNQK